MGVLAWTQFTPALIVGSKTSSPRKTRKRAQGKGGGCCRRPCGEAPWWCGPAEVLRLGFGAVLHLGARAAMAGGLGLGSGRCPALSNRGKGRPWRWSPSIVMAWLQKIQKKKKRGGGWRAYLWRLGAAARRRRRGPPHPIHPWVGVGLGFCPHPSIHPWVGSDLHGRPRGHPWV